MQYEIHRGDCIAAMRAMPDNSVDSIVTDPPYELGFMGKSWDASGIAYSVEMWREALRVLKPGGHLLAFSGSRTYHRMTCAIEDAGFEVRDQIMWVYGSGMPKSFNLAREVGKSICGCSTGALPYTHENTEQKTECGLHSVRHADVSPSVDSGEGRGQVLQPSLPQSSAPGNGAARRAGEYEGREQSSLEGRGNDVQAQGQLQGDSVHSGVGLAAPDGAQGRLHHGTSGGDGAVVRLPADPHGGGAPHRPRPDEQPAQQSGTVAGQPQSQTSGAWPLCGGCGLPVVPSGLGTALKPAHEPICVARKPLVGTVAANVLAHGTGALNIDGCRVGEESTRRTSNAGTNGEGWGMGKSAHVNGSDAGRWPANLIHDGSDEVLALFPQAKSGGNVSGAEPSRVTNGIYGDFADRVAFNGYADSGSAARFFYCAKASKSDRGPNNTHPTVKPLALMQYLCCLVTPPGGHVLDPFAGSGSTVVAALREGFRVTGIELLADHADIMEGRIEHEFYGDIL